MTDTPLFLSHVKPFLQETWKKSGFEEPTAIQSKAIPYALEGKDVILESPTGTGKTLAYLLPLLHRIDTEKKGLQALILAPSRELVMQIYEEFQKWAEGSGITGTSLIGGANIKRQLEKLKKRPQVIVATPLRIYELIQQKKLKMHEVRTIVLDEGDQLTSQEHVETIKQLIKTTLKERQLIFASATLPSSAESIAKDFMHEPEVIKIKKDEALNAKVDHLYVVCEAREKIEVLRKIVKMGAIKALAFVHDIGELSVTGEKLKYKGVRLSMLHSELGKREREAALKGFRQGEFSLLLVTDVAARGLDIEGLTHVIHFGFPRDATQYTHRSGRTGRAGAKGTIISIVTPAEERQLKKFARELNITLQKKVLYRGEMV